MTDEGDLVYVFPELMRTAAAGKSLTGGTGSLAMRGSNALVSTAGGLPLGWAERPDGWRPRVGDRVTIAGVSRGW